MVRFSESFPDWEIVRTACGQLAWSHFRILIYIDEPLRREFYSEMAVVQRWSVRDLKAQINAMFNEHVALSKKSVQEIRLL